MRVYLIALGGWVLLNLLYLLIVMPPRKSSASKPLVKVIGAVRGLFRRLTK